MTRFARIVLATMSVDRLDHFEEAPDPNPEKGWDWRPCPTVAPPAHDPNTEILEGPDYVVQPAQVDETWNVRQMTPQEEDNTKTIKVDAADLILLKMVVISLKLAFDHENRIRVLEGKQPIQLQDFINAVKEPDWPATLQQFKSVVKQLI